MKTFRLILAFFALIGASECLYACGFYAFSSDANNVDIHRVRYLYQEPVLQRPEEDLIELHPGQAFYSLGIPSNIKVQVYANGDPENTRICDVHVTSQDVDVQPETQHVNANVTAQCPEARFNSKTCELKLTGAS